MKTHQYKQKVMWTKNMTKNISGLLIGLMLLLILVPVTKAQEMLQEHEEPVQTYSMPKWLFGIGGGANFNFFEGTIRNLSESSFNNGPFIAPAAFHEGSGIKPYIAGIFEHRFNDRWGLSMNLGYDARGGVWDEIMAPCDCLSELETNISYFVFEPSLRFAPFRKNFHLFAGPRLAYIYQNDFKYQREQQFLDEQWVHEAEFGDVKDLIISMQVGAGYDINLSKPEREMKWVLTPFVSFHPYFGQVPRDIDSWNITTVRAGLALKLGRGVPIPLPEPPVEPEIEEIEPEEPIIAEPPVTFTIRPPVLETRRITNEVFPLRNYVFFEEGASSIPDRYIILSNAEAQQFSEAGLKDKVLIDTRRQGNSQMHVYYNILNILGDRMRNNPNTSITLVGSSAGKGTSIGQQQAEAIKEYLVSVFNIATQRITTRGSDWPEVRSYRHAQQTDVELRLASDRRVDILTSDKELLMTDVRRPSSMLKPVMFSRSDEGELDSHVIFTLTNAERYMEEWYVELTDPNGLVLEFGPFTGNMESVPGQEILDRAAPGQYDVVMKGLSSEGLEFTQETTMELIPKEVTDHHVIRFSMLYEFDRSETPAPYKEYLVEAVVPLVPENARVIIHGHTDIIGNEEHNYHLSLERARSAKLLIESALETYNINGVEFEVYGFGELKEHAPFQNRYPEERFYNRTVIIDIIPR